MTSLIAKEIRLKGQRSKVNTRILMARAVKNEIHNRNDIYNFVVLQLTASKIDILDTLWLGIAHCLPTVFHSDSNKIIDILC